MLQLIIVWDRSVRNLSNILQPYFKISNLLSGLLTTVDDVIPANIGLKDQLFALEWVQENIELFGGNKSSVTIDGQSAGSGAVDMHLMGRWPNNKGHYIIFED